MIKVPVQSFYSMELERNPTGRKGLIAFERHSARFSVRATPAEYRFRLRWFLSRFGIPDRSPCSFEGIPEYCFGTARRN